MVRFEVDRAKRRLKRFVGGDGRGDAIADEFMAHYRAHPEHVVFDVITDYRDYTGPFEWGTLRDYAERTEAFFAERVAADPTHVATPRRIAVVMTSPMASMLTRAMQPLHRRMTLRVFSTIEDAEAWLDGPATDAAPDATDRQVGRGDPGGI